MRRPAFRARPRLVSEASIRENVMRVTVIGGGYVGLVTAAGLADIEHEVTCLESSLERVAQLQAGHLPIFEPGLPELVAMNRAASRLSFSSDYQSAIAGADLIFLAVNTPEGVEGHADTRFVFTAARAALEHARDGQVLVVKSTVPVGTADALAALARTGGGGVSVVSNPEFLREGMALTDFFKPDRIVIGKDDEKAAAVVASAYSMLSAPVIQCSRRSAELAKYAANALLAARISFMNEIAGICQEAGADIDEVTSIVGADRRIGENYLKAGLGWGGSCFPKDIRALVATARALGRTPLILEAVSQVNALQRHTGFSMLKSHLGPGSAVAILGLAFKPDTDDIRGAPALEVMSQLLQAGYRVKAHDPAAVANARAVYPEVEYSASAYDAVEGAAGLLLATEWPEYLALDWQRVHDLMHGHVVLDGRNILDPALLCALGFRYLSFGRHINHHLNGNERSPLARAAVGVVEAN